MNWNSFAEFIAMGGYGLYVWGAFGTTAAVIACELLSLRSRRRALKGGTHMHRDADRIDTQRTDPHPDEMHPIDARRRPSHTVNYARAAREA
jgi:heme exporter protein D